ncbi:DUF2292 domain-containing protein [Caldithrix abyssi]
MDKKSKIKIEVTETEAKLIEFWRSLEYGEMTIKIQDGRPMDVLRMEKRVDLKQILS